MNGSTPKWKNRYEATITTAGVTVVALLEHDDFGWKLGVWKRTIGMPKSHPEGQPIYRQTYADFDDAYSVFTEYVTDAVTHPAKWVESTDTLVSAPAQRRIEEASVADLAAPEQLTKNRRRR